MAGAKQAGFTYLGALFLIVLMGAALAGAGQLWSTAALRAKERDLIWIGTQYAHALRRYYDSSPGVKQYPIRLEELLEDNRHPIPRRHLRRLYPDPFTGRADWETVLTADGRIAGIYSQSAREAMKTSGFPPEWADFEGRRLHSEWTFVAERAFLSGARPEAESSIRPAGSAPQSARP